MYIVVIVLIVLLILAGIAASAVQQHKQKKESAIRDEMNKQRAVIEETEGAITAAGQMPVSQQLLSILHKRVLNALKNSYETNPSLDVKQRISDTSEMLRRIDVNDNQPDYSQFQLPENDKVIIKYIQAVKKLRVMLRAEHSKGLVPPKVFTHEDFNLERLQLRVNVETLAKRARDAMRSNMQGSARQYLEKAINVLKGQKNQDEYTKTRMAEFESMMNSLESLVQQHMQAQIQADKDAENEEINELFAPKKKW